MTVSVQTVSQSGRENISWLRFSAGKGMGLVAHSVLENKIRHRGLCGSCLAGGGQAAQTLIRDRQVGREAAGKCGCWGGASPLWLCTSSHRQPQLLGVDNRGSRLRGQRGQGQSHSRGTG